LQKLQDFHIYNRLAFFSMGVIGTIVKTDLNENGKGWGRSYFWKLPPSPSSKNGCSPPPAGKPTPLSAPTRSPARSAQIGIYRLIRVSVERIRGEVWGQIGMENFMFSRYFIK
jgi:hypothetical protein